MSFDSFDDPARRRTVKEMPVANEPPPAEPPLAVEVALVNEPAGATRPEKWRALEIWTAKSVYAIDGQMLCMGVMERATGRIDDKHRFLGARLMGGERKLNGALSFSYPLPVPESDAIFQVGSSGTRGRYGHTSPVEKVVVRIRVTHAPSDSSEAVWEEIRKTWPPLRR